MEIIPIILLATPVKIIPLNIMYFAADKETVKTVNNNDCSMAWLVYTSKLSKIILANTEPGCFLTWEKKKKHSSYLKGVL